MQKPIWHEYNFKAASDYSQGTPEEIRSTLRKDIGIPELLPGETDDTVQTEHRPKYSFRDLIKFTG